MFYSTIGRYEILMISMNVCDLILMEESVYQMFNIISCAH